MLVDDPNKVAYWNDNAVAVGFEGRTFEERKKYAERLIAKDKITFKKFVLNFKEFVEYGLFEETLNDLLRIDADKLLNDDIVEYLD